MVAVGMPEGRRAVFVFVELLFGELLFAVGMHGGKHAVLGFVGMLFGRHDVLGLGLGGVVVTTIRERRFDFMKLS